MDEIDILKEMRHPNIIRLYDTFDEKEYYYLVTEKMMGGELFDRIVQKSYYNEKEARDTSRVLFEAMLYIHSKKIAHRDLKPENLLLLVRVVFGYHTTLCCDEELLRRTLVCYGWTSLWPLFSTDLFLLLLCYATHTCIHSPLTMIRISKLPILVLPNVVHDQDV
jgi:hypothetical protein